MPLPECRFRVIDDPPRLHCLHPRVHVLRGLVSSAICCTCPMAATDDAFDDAIHNDDRFLDVALDSLPAVLSRPDDVLVAAGAFLVDFDPALVAIAMTTAPRGVPTLDACLDSLRLAGFDQPVHLFAEPGAPSDDWTRPGVVLHRNERRLGCYPNWLRAAEHLLSATDKPHLLLLEDDGEFCRGAAAALYFGLAHLESIGCLSLYTPAHNRRAGRHTETGWFPLRAPDRWGTVAQCFPRSVLERFVREADRSHADGTDRHLEAFLGRRGLRWYSHAPSLADHVGECSTLGHATGPANAGIGFRPDFVGYRVSPTAAPAPRVSIVLPVYDGARYLAESIESCLCQTLADWELIVVDDGSTDDTGRIVRSFRDPRIHSLRHAVNRRLPAALNTGFRQCRGEYLTWTSCDNRYAPHALEVLARRLDEDPAVDLIYSDFDLIDENGALLRRHHAGPTAALAETNVVGMCFLYRRSVYEAVGDYDDEAFLAEDYDYWLRAAASFRLVHLPRVLYEFRMHEGSLTARFADRIPLVAQSVRERWARRLD
ncbi:MAG: glycosyltransferase family 2 protein [Planctomycetia bacterium]